MTLKFNSVRAVVKVHVRAKYHQTKRSGSWVIVLTSFFCPIAQWWKLRKSGPVTLTFDLWPWNFLSFVRLSRNMFVQNFTGSGLLHSYFAYRAETPPKTIQSAATARTVIYIFISP